MIKIGEDVSVQALKRVEISFSKNPEICLHVSKLLNYLIFQSCLNRDRC